MINLEELHQFVDGLCELGKHQPKYLLLLTDIVKPHMPDPVSILVSIFTNIKQHLYTLHHGSNLDLTHPQINQYSEEFYVLLQLRELSTLLKHISDIQLLHLANNNIPPGPHDYQLSLIKKIQQFLSQWTESTLQTHNHTLNNTPLALQRQTLLLIEPSIPNELHYFFIDLLRLPWHELVSFHDFMMGASDLHLIFLTRLLSIEVAILLELKQCLLNPFLAPGLFKPLASPPLLPTKDVASLKLSAQLKLEIVTQPPAKIVYQRILKPFPVVRVVDHSGAPPQSLPNNLFVNATLLRGDSNVAVALLEGANSLQIHGAACTFKKLKIQSTSQQQGSFFRIKFGLQRYEGDRFFEIVCAEAVSSPIEVVSHTSYLERVDVTQLAIPSVSEILPPSGPASGNSRIVILGCDFIKNPNLRVRFGSSVIVPEYHEPKTLVCNTPPIPRPAAVAVQVSNDGIVYCRPTATFQYF